MGTLKHSSLGIFVVAALFVGVLMAQSSNVPVLEVDPVLAKDAGEIHVRARPRCGH